MDDKIIILANSIRRDLEVIAARRPLKKSSFYRRGR